MKKQVTPSPWMAIFFGAISAFCVFITFSGIISGVSALFPEVLIDLLVIGVFIWLLQKYLSQKKILFDETCFTVDGKTYSYEAITNVTADAEQVIRNIPTIRMKIYIDGEEICSFTKADKGGKDFISVLKRNDVAVNIEV